MAPKKTTKPDSPNAEKRRAAADDPSERPTPPAPTSVAPAEPAAPVVAMASMPDAAREAREAREALARLLAASPTSIVGVSGLTPSQLEAYLEARSRAQTVLQG